MMHRRFIAFFACLIWVAAPAWAEDEPVDHYKTAIDAIMTFIADDDRAAFAGVIIYPLRFWHDGKELFSIGNPADLLLNYETILAVHDRQHLLALPTDGYQRFTEGVMIGAGEIWFDEDVSKIRSMNLFETAPDLIAAPFDDAYRSSKELGLTEFEWQGARFTTN